MDNNFITNEVLAFHRDNNPWLKLSNHFWDALTKDYVPTSYKKNSVIYHQGDVLSHVYIVKDGRVRLGYYSKDGEEKGIYIAEKNSMFGETVALPSYAANYTATAIVDCNLYVVPVSQLIHTIQTDPDFAMRMVMMLSRKVRIYASQAIELSSTETYERVCHALLYLAQTYGEQTKDGLCIKVRFTHQELANMTHLSRVSVSNVFSELMKCEVISKKDGYYYVYDIEELMTDY